MKILKNLRNRFERFCFRHRDKGIPNLMLYITIGSALVYIMSMFNGGSLIYNLICFDKAAILKGQVWRLLTHIFTYAPGANPVLVIVFMYFFYNLSRHTESMMGTFRFNLFYFSGVVLMDLFAMLFCPTTDVVINGVAIDPEYFRYAVYSNMALYLHLSIVLMFATMNPNAQFLVLFIIPVKAWIMGLIDLLLIAASIFNASFPVPLFPHNLFPLIGVLNYLLFAGKDVLNLFPFIAVRPRRKAQKQNFGSIPFRQTQQTSRPYAKNYSHRCTVCGRTDVSDPELEFRYCSRCQGYHCYCEEHITNHIHIETSEDI